MPIPRPQFANDEIYHVVVRGAGDLPIFKGKSDRYRAVFSLYEFNDTKPVIMRNRRKLRRKFKKIGRERFSASSRLVRDRLVDIFAFCFMPNHIHLLLKQLQEGGVTLFMRKFGAGYAGYFNKKYDRKGHLFQGRFRAAHVRTDDQLKTVFVYVHTNPVSLIEPGWKEKGIQNPERIIEFLEEDYKWSSYPDYIGRDNFPFLTERDFLLKTMGGKENCKRFVENWVRYKGEIEVSNNIFLE